MAINPEPHQTKLMAAAVVVIMTLGACAEAPVSKVAVQKPALARKTKQPAQKHPLELVGKITGRGWYLPWYVRNPKNRNGPPVPVLKAEAKTGEITRRNGKPEIIMHDVSALLYQKGVEAANIQAGKVRANQSDKKVFASSGCTVVSLTQPPDTVLTADRITWDIDSALFVAEGHAHVVRRPRNGGMILTQDGGKIIYDLQHDTIAVY